MRQQELRSFDMATLDKLKRLRGKKDELRFAWAELESILLENEGKIKKAWKQMEKSSVVVGEVWKQKIGEVSGKHKVHRFEYLCVKSPGLAVAEHGHAEPANYDKQTRKVKEWYVFPDGKVEFCGKDSVHKLSNNTAGPLYVLSIKTSHKGKW